MFDWLHLAIGKVKEWSYDNRNVFTTVTYDGDTVLSKSTDAGYRCTSETFGNGLLRGISFGRQDNLRTLDRVFKSGNVIDELDFNYGYTANKNVLHENGPNGMFADLSFETSYDDGNRGTSWYRNAAYESARENQSWSYDAAGNWNLTTIDGDVQGRTDNGSDEITHRYEAFFRRVHREFGSTDEVLLWWGKEEYAEHENIGSQPAIQNDLRANPTGLNTTFGRALEGSKHDIHCFHKDYLDHVHAVNDEHGDIVEHYRYIAFGESEFYNESGEQLAGSAIDNDILWNVKRYSEAGGLYMYLYCHYEAEHGRWPSRDPIEERGGVSLYGFVSNSPINRTDRLGLTINMLAPFYDTLANVWATYGVYAFTGEPGQRDISRPKVEGSDEFETKKKDGLCCIKVKKASQLTINVRTVLPSDWGNPTNINGTMTAFSREGYNSTIRHEFRRRGVYTRANRAFLEPAEKSGAQVTKCGWVCRDSYDAAEEALSDYLDDLRTEVEADYLTYVMAEQGAIGGEGTANDGFEDWGVGFQVFVLKPFTSIHSINEPVPNWGTNRPPAP